MTILTRCPLACLVEDICYGDSQRWDAWLNEESSRTLMALLLVNVDMGGFTVSL